MLWICWLILLYVKPQSHSCCMGLCPTKFNCPMHDKLKEDVNVNKHEWSLCPVMGLQWLNDLCTLTQHTTIVSKQFPGQFMSHSHMTTFRQLPQNMIYYRFGVVLIVLTRIIAFPLSAVISNRWYKSQILSFHYCMSQKKWPPYYGSEKLNKSNFLQVTANKSKTINWKIYSAACG